MQILVDYFKNTLNESLWDANVEITGNYIISKYKECGI